MYLYMAVEDDFSAVPEALMDRFGKPQFVMELALSADRSLARVDADKVRASLDENGFFLQMPPELKPELYHGNED